MPPPPCKQQGPNWLSAVFWYFPRPVGVVTARSRWVIRRRKVSELTTCSYLTVCDRLLHQTLTDCLLNRTFWKTLTQTRTQRHNYYRNIDKHSTKSNSVPAYASLEPQAAEEQQLYAAPLWQWRWVVYHKVLMHCFYTHLDPAIITRTNPNPYRIMCLRMDEKVITHIE